VLREMNITRDDPALVKAVPWPRGGHLPDTFSLLRIESPALVLSAARRSERDTLIVRCYNITRGPVESAITCGLPLAGAYRANLAEERGDPLPVRDGRRVDVAAGPGQAITVELVFAGQEG